MKITVIVLALGSLLPIAAFAKASDEQMMHAIEAAPEVKAIYHVYYARHLDHSGQCKDCATKNPREVAKDEQPKLELKDCENDLNKPNIRYCDGVLSKNIYLANGQIMELTITAKLYLLDEQSKVSVNGISDIAIASELND